MQTSRSTRARKNGNDLLGLLAVALVQGLCRAGTSVRAAESAALEAIANARMEFAGFDLYFPAKRPTAKDRKSEALALWTAGNGIEAIAAQLGVTPRYAALLVACARSEPKTPARRSQRRAP